MNSNFTSLETSIVICLSLMIIVTIIGNILVCLSVVLVRKLRSPSNYLLVSLAISDLCVAILVMPLALNLEVKGYWDLGQTLCDMWVSFDVTSCTASILNLCMISVDRYLTITKPLTYGVKRTTKRMFAFIATVWISSCLISIPPLLVLGNEHGSEAEPSCQVSQNIGYQLYATLGAFYIPLMVMIILYYKIYGAAKSVVDAELRSLGHTSNRFFPSLKPLLRPTSTGKSEDCQTVLRSDICDASHPSRGPSCWTKSESPYFERHRETNGDFETDTHHSLHHNHHPIKETGFGDVYPPNGTMICNKDDDSSNPHHHNNNLHSSIVSSCKRVKDSMLPTSSSSKNGNHHLHQHHQSRPNSSSNGSSGTTTVNITGRKSLVDRLTGSNGTSSTTTEKRRTSSMLKERKASITLGVIMTAFTACWLPFFILALLRPFSKTVTQIPHWISSFVYWLGLANSMLNPIIYVTFHHDFRKAFRYLLCLQCSTMDFRLRERAYQSQYGGDRGSRQLSCESRKALQIRDAERFTSNQPEQQQIMTPTAAKHTPL